MFTQARMRFRSVALSTALLVWCCGCGGSGVSVSGKVLNGANPLKAGMVTFYPDKEKGNTGTKLAQAAVAGDGTYTLYTDGKPGAPPGWYKVTVVAEASPAGGSADAEGAAAYGSPVYLVAEEYTDPEMTPLSVEVKPDAPPGHFDLKLAPRPR